MKVLIIANYAQEHINKFHLETIRRFKELGWQVDVASRADAEVPGADRVFDLPMERNPFRLRSLSAIRQLKEILRQGDYQAIHCHTMAGKVIGILAARHFRRSGLRILYTSHGFQYYSGAPLRNWLALPLDKWLMRYVDVLITINREDDRNARRFRFKAKHLFQCHGAGVPLERFRQEGTPRQAVRESLGIPADAKVLNYVAELNRNKNQEYLLRMFAQLKTEIPDLYMLLVGPDHYDGRIQREIQSAGDAGRILCLGWRSDVGDLIRASDVAVASSIREGFGINIVEYMACGVPVVATDNRGHRETIEDGVTGYLTPLRDPSMMADRVRLLLTDADRRSAVTSAASERLPQYDEQTIVQQIVDIYRNYVE